MLITKLINANLKIQKIQTIKFANLKKRILIFVKIKTMEKNKYNNN